MSKYDGLNPDFVYRYQYGTNSYQLQFNGRVWEEFNLETHYAQPFSSSEALLVVLQGEKLSWSPNPKFILW